MRTSSYGPLFTPNHSPRTNPPIHAPRPPGLALPLNPVMIPPPRRSLPLPKHHLPKRPPAEVCVPLDASTRPCTPFNSPISTTRDIRYHRSICHLRRTPSMELHLRTVRHIAPQICINFPRAIPKISLISRLSCLFLRERLRRLVHHRPAQLALMAA